MIAIIMATYNGAAYLWEQLESIRVNSERGWRLYLFDDGSDDATVRIAEEYVKRDPERFHLCRNPRNLGSARNFYCGVRQVAEEAPADYYMFADQDDIWDRDKIAVTLRKMKELERTAAENAPATAPAPVAVFTDARLADAEGKEFAPSFFAASRLDSGKRDLAHLLMENKLPGCTMMINAALLAAERQAEQAREGKKSWYEAAQAGEPVPWKMHDWWFALAAAGLGTVGFVERATISYRQHGKNVVGGTDFKGYVRSRLESLSSQKQALRENMEQGRAFYRQYRTLLSGRRKEAAEAFAQLCTSGWLKRRALVIRYGFWKSGLVRNVALLLLV